MTCSGIHRKLGTHISQVRSITLDTWTPSQIAHFQKLGNSKAEKYFEACLPSDFRRPHSSDSMRMEGFIREKYEHRRFITVENGGLGGEPVRGASSSFSSLGSRPKQAAPPRQLYDDVGGSASSGLSRFSNKPQFQPSQPPAPPRSAVRNPLARATTLRELVNMGFSTDISLRAVEASSGDLERAVNWILQNSDQAVTAPKPQATVPAKNTETNLLDFDDENSTSSSLKAPVATTEKPSISQLPGVMSAKPSHVADFADFGDFESALPTTHKSQSHVQTTENTYAGKSAFRSNLADLYKKPIPSASMKQAGTLDSKLATSSISAPAGLHMSKSSPAPFLEKGSYKSPGRADSKVTMDRSKLGLPFIDLQNAKLSQGDTKAKEISGHVSNKSIRQPITRSPPPPPMQEAAIMTTKDGPSPPSPLISTVPQISEEKHREILSGKKPESTDTSEEKQEAVEDDEDPFAALSMMALSSATTNKTKSKPNSNNKLEKNSNKDATVSFGNGSLDDILG